uniref:U4/U6.U5 tri-snRNP-associated protein 1 n=1 Tax=Strigamia maritima TaxID=126957 RepID=T1IIN4_STRMM
MEIDEELPESVSVKNKFNRVKAEMDPIKRELTNKYDEIEEVEYELKDETESTTDDIGVEKMKFKKPKKTTREMRKPKLTLITNSMETETDDSENEMISNEEISLRPLNFDRLDTQLMTKVRRVNQTRGTTLKSLVTSIMSRPARSIIPEETENCVTFSSSLEFCRDLGELNSYGSSGNRDENPNDVIDLNESLGLLEDPKEVVQCDETDRGGWNEVGMNEKPIEPAMDEKGVKSWCILEPEPDLSVGIAGALKLSMMKGLFDKEEKPLLRSSKVVDARESNYRIDDKYGADHDDTRGRRRENFNSGPTMSFTEKVNYKPEIRLEYTDDQGNALNSKEAFRHMSHKFHGIESGKNKTEKRLKKLQQEALSKKMSSDDTPLHTLQLLKDKQKKTNLPYVVINNGKKPGHFNVISK